MKCLTVRQPWAWALIHGGKDLATRREGHKHTSWQGLRRAINAQEGER